MYDVVIVGGGPAGLTAALYASRRSLKTLVLTRDLGGQAAKTFDIENYPGITHITGIELAKSMKDQAERFGAEIKFEEAKKILPLDDGNYTIETINNKYNTKCIILAFGKQPRELGIPGEEEFKGRGVSYCATCDAPFFRGKTVAIVGGGNSALDAAILTAGIADKVYLIHRSRFTGEDILIERVQGSKNIEIIMPDEISKIEGENIVKSITLKSGKKLDVDGVLVEIGYVVDRSLADGLIKINDSNQVITSDSLETSLTGIFAAGDLTTTPYKQIVIAAGEGAKAALSCYDYIQRKDGKKGIIGDWQKLATQK